VREPLKIPEVIAVSPPRRIGRGAGCQLDGVSMGIDQLDEQLSYVDLRTDDHGYQLGHAAHGAKSPQLPRW
jgi:hypothetical protein